MQFDDVLKEVRELTEKPAMEVYTTVKIGNLAAFRVEFANGNVKIQALRSAAFDGLLTDPGLFLLGDSDLHLIAALILAARAKRGR